MLKAIKALDETLATAVQHHLAGRLAEAETLYRQILRQHPNHSAALHYLGALAGEAQQYEAAVQLLRRSIAMQPSDARVYGTLSMVLRNMGRKEDAITACQQALALEPWMAVAQHQLGVLFREQGQLPAAIDSFRRALTLNPASADTMGELAGALLQAGQGDEAIALYRQAIAVQPSRTDLYNNLGNALCFEKQYEEAMGVFRQAIKLDPRLSATHNNLANAQKELGQLDEALGNYRKALEYAPQSPVIHSNLVSAMNFHPGCDAPAIARELALWNQRYAVPLRGTIQPHTNDRNPDRALRIGYVSPDFRAHAIGLNMLPLFRHHDTRQFAIHCYASVVKPDAITEQFRSLAKCWRPIGGMSDQLVARQVRADQIDILVDLTMHLQGTRLLVFARKPAPVQVTFAGYPGSTGLETIAYRLSDPYLDPVGMAEDYYREKTVRLPHSFWCYAPESEQPAVNALPASTQGVVTFGCLNNFSKVHPGVLEWWAKILQQVPGSRLLVLSATGAHREQTGAFLAQRGLAGERLEFVSGMPREQYLRQYQRIDIVLDTFPYNGHTTSLDALWMGVPVVTLVGQTVVGRAGYSHLMNLQMPELIAQTHAEYVQIAAGLARDLPRLAGLRQCLRGRLQQSPLADAAGFARGIEAAYRQMWRTWCGSGG